VVKERSAKTSIHRFDPVAACYSSLRSFNRSFLVQSRLPAWMPNKLSSRALGEQGSSRNSSTTVYVDFLAEKPGNACLRRRMRCG